MRAESRQCGLRRPFVRRRKRPGVQMSSRADGWCTGTGGRGFGLMPNYPARPSPASGEAVRSALSARDDVDKQEERLRDGRDRPSLPFQLC